MIPRTYEPDGIVRSVDFSKRNPAEWTVRQVHDIFWDAGATEGQPAYDPPVVGHEGNLVVLIATGNIDRLDSSAQNRVVSLTEKRTLESRDLGYQTELNWEVRLHEAEQVTGQLELFEGKVYFASFESGADPSQVSGGPRGDDGAIATINVALPTPASFTQITGFAGRVDY